MPRGKAQTISPERVKWLLLSTEINDHAAAAELGVSYQTIQQIRTGKMYLNTFPDLPRRRTGNCYLCENMMKHLEHDVADGRSKPTPSYRCGFEFPDFAEEGPNAARDCALYKVKSKPSSHSTTSSSRSTRQKV
jgi:hypothetical protein